MAQLGWKRAGLAFGTLLPRPGAISCGVLPKIVVGGGNEKRLTASSFRLQAARPRVYAIEPTTSVLARWPRHPQSPTGTSTDVTKGGIAKKNDIQMEPEPEPEPEFPVGF